MDQSSALIFNIQKFCLHDGPGIRTTIFFKGCNLRCNWCSNPESWESTIQQLDNEICGQYYTVESLYAEIIKDVPFYTQSGGGITFSGGEALLNVDFLIDICIKLHKVGINTALETAGYIDSDTFSKVLMHIDYLMIDLKHHDDKQHILGTSVSNSKIINNIRYALENTHTHTTVRIPIIPGYNNSYEDAQSYAKLLNKLNCQYVHLLPFHQLGEIKYRQLHLPYKYSGYSSLHSEDIEKYNDILKHNSITSQIGG